MADLTAVETVDPAIQATVEEAARARQINSQRGKADILLALLAAAGRSV